jgi:hypothetical protein
MTDADISRLNIGDSPENTPSLSHTQQNLHAGQHQALEQISIVDCATQQEIIPNSVPVNVENEFLSGQVFLMVRTPDVDNTKEALPTGETPQRISKYMKGKKRRFEFQFQVKFKRIPTGPLFLGSEVEERLKVSKFTKRLTTVLLAMIRKITPGFHYSWGTDMKDTTPEGLKQGNYEKSHLSFPVETSMNRIIITKPGEEPPKLGHDVDETIDETKASFKRRRKIGYGAIDWNTEDTYTMYLWNNYADWIKWKSMNVPGVRPFPLSNVTGKQPVYLCGYELSGFTPQEYRKKKPPHTQSKLRHWTRLELAHRDFTGGGGIAPRFQEKQRYSDETAGETESELVC